MAWGDAWGSGPCRNAKELAEAFYEGRCLKFGKSHVKLDFNHGMECAVYTYNDAVIARRVVHPEELVTWLLMHSERPQVRALEFRPWHFDKGEARHLQALGVDAKWCSNKLTTYFGGYYAGPFNWVTLDDLKALPKWIGPAKKPRHQFVNTTLPLFAP